MSTSFNRQSHRARCRSNRDSQPFVTGNLMGDYRRGDRW
jgi:hypothetical protein